jgi:excisionase family DNA binding protein
MIENDQPAVYRRDFHELLHHEQYTPEEAAFLLGMDVEVIEQAAHRHELPAIFAGHHVMYIMRTELIGWLERR